MSGTKDSNIINSKDNLIHLTYREHYIAHKILVEENQDIECLINALWRMSNHGNIATPEEYDIARKLYSDSLRGNIRASNVSDEEREIRSARMSNYLKDNHPSKSPSIIKVREEHRLNTLHNSIVICPICNKEFNRNSSFRKYCSNECLTIAKILKDYVRLGWISKRNSYMLEKYKSFIDSIK